MAQLSYQVIVLEWLFLPLVSDQICQIFGRPIIDPFATSFWFKCPRLQTPWCGKKRSFSIHSTIWKFTPFPQPYSNLPSSAFFTSGVVSQCIVLAIGGTSEASTRCGWSLTFQWLFLFYLTLKRRDRGSYRYFLDHKHATRTLWVKYLAVLNLVLIKI